MLSALWRTVSVSYWLARLIVFLTKCNCKRQAYEIQHVRMERVFCLPLSLLPSSWHNNMRGSRRKMKVQYMSQHLQCLLPRGVVMDSVFMCQCRSTEREWSEYPQFSPPLVLYWTVNNASDLPHPSAYWLMLCHDVSVETQHQCLNPVSM